MRRLFFGCLFLSGIAHADLTDETVITASRTEGTVDQTIIPTLIIDRQTIALSQATDLAELLRFIAGIDIGRNGGPGQTTSAFIRGAESNQTLVLIDGVRINPGTIGGSALQNIDPRTIERVEIVKGPRSTQYGSDAIGGVIQIFTRRGAGNRQWHASGGWGTNRARLLAAGGSFSAGRMSAGLEVSQRRTDGFPTRIGSALDRGQDITSISSTLAASAGRHDITLRHWQAQGNTEYLGFLLNPLDQDFHNSVSSLVIDSQFSAAWNSTLRVSRTRDEIDQNQGADFAHTKRDVLDWQNDFQLTPNQLFSAGVVFSRETTRAVSFGLGFDEDTAVRSLFLQHDMRLGAHRVRVALRGLKHDSFGAHTTGELSWRQNTGDAAAFTASLSTGFRAPDATDRFGFGGNPRLAPERSRNAEVGFQYATPGGRFNATLFDNLLEDLIVFQDVDGFFGPLPGRNENVERARIRGLELAWRHRSRHWRTDLQAVVQEPRNPDTGRTLARRARRALTANLIYHTGPWRTGVRLLATGPRPDSDFSDTINPGYVVIDLSTARRIGRRLTLRGRVENLLDRDYVLADGFRSQGRAVLIQLDITSPPAAQ